MGNNCETESQTQNSPALEKFMTTADIEEHIKDKAGAVVIIIHGKVYDVTQFKAEHPGGAEVLEEWHCKDASQSFDDIGHSPDALDMMNDYLLGLFKS